jgi:zinc protease
MRLRYTPRFCAIALLTLLLATVLRPVQAQEAAALDIVTYTLDNGLAVILVEDRSAPTVAVDVWYDVGGANDQENRSGFAHLFEHLMFQGSANVAPGEHFRLIAAAGGDANATTGIDRTNYFQTLPSHQLPLALWLEAERMRSLRITEENFVREREVVKEEYRLRVENQPYGQAQLLWQTLPFDYEPYESTVIGSIEDLDAATLDEVLAFHDAYYKPNNATLTVAGDIDVEQTQALIEQYFGTIVGEEEAPTLPEYEFTLQEESQAITVTDPLAQVPATFVAYRIPSRADDDYYALEVLARILGVGNSSRLAQALVDTGQAAAASVLTQGNVGPSLLSAILIPNPGVEPQQLVDVYDEELTRLREGEVSDDELEKAVNQIRAQTLTSLESVLSVAENVQAANFYLGDPERLLDELARYEEVTVDDIARVAEQYLTPTSRNVINVAVAQAATPTQPRSPLAQPASPLTPSTAITGTVAPTVTSAVTNQATSGVTETVANPTPQPTITATPTLSATGTATETATTDERVAPPTPLPVRSLNLPEVTESELDNGLTVISVPQHQLPIFTVVLVVPGGESAAATEPGLAGLTASLLTRGTTERSAQEIAGAIEQLGGQLAASANQDTVNVFVTGLRENLDESFALLGDVTLNPTFPEDELALARQQTLTGLQVTLSTPAFVAQQLLNQTLYGDHPYGATVTPAGVADITRPDLVDYYEAQFHPNEAILLVIGDVTHEEAVDRAEATFGDWPATDEAETVDYPTPPERTEQAIYLIDRPGSTQATMALGHLLPEADEEERYALTVANQILGAGPSSRLFQTLREERGYTYGIFSGLTTPRDQSSLIIQASVRNEVVAPALTAILLEMTDLRTTSAPTAELTSAKSYLIGNYALQTETATAVASRILDLHLRGLPLDALADYPTEIEAVDAAAVQTAAERYILPNEIAIVVVGDADQIEEALETVAPVTRVPDPLTAEQE